MIGWLRANLFSSPLNAALTVMALAFLWLAVPPLVDWALLDADWTGTTRDDCRGAGACWVFVRVRFDQFVYGFYPESERWRVDIGFLLLAAGIAPFVMPTIKRGHWPAVFLFGVYPLVAFFLFAGGAFGLPPVPTERWGGLMLTLVIAGVGIGASLPIGVLLALGRRSAMPVIRVLCVMFIEFWRGIPLITVLFMASVMLPLFLPQGATIDKLLRALIGVALFAGAYMAEVVRGGLQAIPRGQYEAAEALGLGYWTSMARVILPQALRIVVPGMANVAIALFKDTTLVLIISLFDFLGMIQAALTDPEWLGFAAEGYVFAAAVYWVFCFAMSRYSRRLESDPVNPTRP